MCQKRLYTQEEQRTIRDFKQVHKHDTCHYCGNPLCETNTTVDHLLPYSRGGETIADNLVMACKKCNTDKADLTESEYIKYREDEKNIIANDETINKIKIMMDTNNSIEKSHLKALADLRSKQLEQYEIEKCIRDINFSAADGYKLCKELKDCFIAISEINKKCHSLFKLKKAVSENNDKLRIVYDDLMNCIHKDLRVSFNIGHNGDARKIS